MRFEAKWVDAQTVALPSAAVRDGLSYELVYSAPAAGLALTPVSTAGGYTFFKLPPNTDLQTITAAIKGKLAVASKGSEYTTGVQVAGVLDHLFYFGGKLGPQFPDDRYENLCVSVWAPTAASVKLLLFRNPGDEKPDDVVAMIESQGVWSVEIENSWRGAYYLYSVNVYVASLGEFVENVVTDPYSTDLALNGIKSRLTDLNAPQTKPEGWDDNLSPPIRSHNDLTIYELHVRDFSASDESVPVEQRGTYLAFTARDSNGMKHLRRLAQAGLKAVHLLPTFHMASVDEDKSKWKSPGDLSRFPPNGFQQQSAVEAIKSEDAYNWGYDPVHYLAPEGSYAVNPYARVKEYRSMVQALHEAGLRVIQDQVFNHTHASGQADNSVLDKIVPGYYYRLDEEGTVLNASCCSDTASEHKMMEKLMVDCLLQNARHYKIDGFRFDLMGFHYLSNMLKIRAALPEHIYLYGEGWQCDETSHDVAQPNATQASLYGSGIGSFNDRIRDGIRGGGPYADQRAPGFVTGNYGQGDWIRAGLAGNLRDFVFTDRVSDYNGEPVGYTASTVECVNYCSVHDNQTLFDAIQMKAPLTDDAATRARRHMLALSFIALAQGIPFFHAGDELLRSKDMDNNSYNSGDWFNKLDFSYQSNNWGTGLPLATENQKYWPIMRPLLANPALKPSPADIIRTRDAFEALLRVRTSSGLFRMRTLKEVQSNLRFLDAEPAVIVMRLAANSQRYDGYQQVLVVFNATKGSIRWDTEGLSPHPAMQATGTDTPALATAVFVG